MNYYKPHRFVRLYPEVRACYSVELTRALQRQIPRSLRWWNPTAQCWFVRDLWAGPLHQILRTHGEVRVWDVPERFERTAS